MLSLLTELEELMEGKIAFNPPKRKPTAEVSDGKSFKAAGGSHVAASFKQTAAMVAKAALTATSPLRASSKKAGGGGDGARGFDVLATAGAATAPAAAT